MTMRHEGSAETLEEIEKKAKIRFPEVGTMEYEFSHDKHPTLFCDCSEELYEFIKQSCQQYAQKVTEEKDKQIENLTFDLNKVKKWADEREEELKKQLNLN